MAAATAVAAITAMAEEGIVDHAARVGLETIGPLLEDLAARCDLVGEVRGSGVMWAVELVGDRSTRAPLSARQMASIRLALLEAGLLPLVLDNRIHVTPPAVVTPEEATRGIGIIANVLSASP